MMFERFTPEARRVFLLAQQEATRLGHDFLGTEHVLLGLMMQDRSVAAQALKHFSVAYDVVRAQIEETVRPGGDRCKHLPFTPRAKKTLELSLREALGLGHNFIGTGHMLLGILRQGECSATGILQRLGVDLRGLHAKVIDEVTEAKGASPDTAQEAASAYRLYVNRRADGATIGIMLNAPAGYTIAGGTIAITGPDGAVMEHDLNGLVSQGTFVGME